jgi:hypothetical protein
MRESFMSVVAFREVRKRLQLARRELSATTTRMAVDVSRGLSRVAALQLLLAGCTSNEAPERDPAATHDAGRDASDDADLPEADAAPSDRDSGMPEPGRDAPSQPVSFTASSANMLNPERGFYTTTRLTSPGDLAYVRAEGKTLVYAAAHLDDYLGDNHEQDLPEHLLTDVQAGFDAVRAAGIKAVVRFQYDDGERYPAGANDATEATMLRHIAQLAPLLSANEDVLFLLQAGFIGAWGEWHTSLNFVDGPDGKEPRQRIVEGLLDALPSSRRVALRYPAYKRMFFGEQVTSLDDLLASSGRARAAHLNDCFLSSEDDVGTYQYEPLETLKTYLEGDTARVPIGGETCAVHERNACSVATAEMARFHWTYINDQYHREVLARWDDEGCRPDIERKLGYRLALVEGSLPAEVKPGGSMRIALTLRNEGWAAPTNPRPVLLVLEDGGQRLVAELQADPRTWLPGDHELVARLRIPSALAEGDYRLALWLPDAADSLRERADYAIQLANEGTWGAASGDNTLGSLRVTASAEGDAVSDAPQFATIR